MNDSDRERLACDCQRRLEDEEREREARAHLLREVESIALDFWHEPEQIGYYLADRVRLRPGDVDRIDELLYTLGGKPLVTRVFAAAGLIPAPDAMRATATTEDWLAGDVPELYAPARHSNLAAIIRAEWGIPEPDRGDGAGPISAAAQAPPVPAAHAASGWVGVQFKGAPDTDEPRIIEEETRKGLRGPVRRLPHQDRIQKSFGHHDISEVTARVDAGSETAADALGVEAFTKDGQVAFPRQPDLRTAAHEAAHVVQQRAGAVREARAEHERHAEVVADRVVRGESVEELLDRVAIPPPRPGSWADVHGRKRRQLADDVLAEWREAAERHPIARELAHGVQQSAPPSHALAPAGAHGVQQHVGESSDSERTRLEAQADSVGAGVELGMNVEGLLDGLALPKRLSEGRQAAQDAQFRATSEQDGARRPERRFSDDEAAARSEPPAVALRLRPGLELLESLGGRVRSGPEVDRTLESRGESGLVEGRHVYLHSIIARDPDAPFARETIAHEAVHLAQWHGGTAPGPILSVSCGELEREADALSARLLRGAEVAVRPRLGRVLALGKRAALYLPYWQKEKLGMMAKLTIYFDKGRDKTNGDDMSKMDRLVDDLISDRERRGRGSHKGYEYTLSVDGHASPDGDAEDNRILSQHRIVEVYNPIAKEFDRRKSERPHMRHYAFGENESKGSSKKQRELWRRVDVTAVLRRRHIAPPKKPEYQPPKPPQDSPQEKKFIEIVEKALKIADTRAILKHEGLEVNKLLKGIRKGWTPIDVDDRIYKFQHQLDRVACRMGPGGRDHKKCDHGIRDIYDARISILRKSIEANLHAGAHETESDDDHAWKAVRRRLEEVIVHRRKAGRAPRSSSCDRCRRR